MTFSEKNAFLPPLEQCFKGKAEIWSWEDVCYALTASKETFNQIDLKTVLLDSVVQHYLHLPLSLLRAPNPVDEAIAEGLLKKAETRKTKSYIYNIDDVREDAKWLSAKTRIDNYLALKMVMIDRQRQSRSRLLSRFSEEELIAIQDVAGTTMATAWTQPPGQNDPAEGERSVGQRRYDLCLLVATEFRFLSDVYFHILSLGLYTISEFDCENVIGNLKKGLDEETLEACQTIFKATRKNDFSIPGVTEFLKSSINLIDYRLGLYANPEMWADDIDEDGQLDNAWRLFNLTHARNGARHALIQILSMKNIPSINTVQEWFTIVTKFDFFSSQRVRPISPETADVCIQIELCSAVISHAILRSSEIRTIVADDQTMAADYRPSVNENECPYIYDEKCVEFVQNAIVKAAKSELSAAAFSIFSWALIGQTVKDVVFFAREVADGEVAAGRIPPVMGETKWEKLASIVTNKDEMFEMFDGDQSSALLAYALEKFRVIPLVGQIVGKIAIAFPFFTAIPAVTAIRFSFLGFMHETLPILSYSEELLDTIITVVNGGRSFWSHIDDPDPSTDVIAKTFQADRDGFVANVLDQAERRFPLEFGPFLAFVSALSLGVRISEKGVAPIAAALIDMDTFTQILPTEFNGYELFQAINGEHYMRLIRPIWLLTARTSWGRHGQEEKGFIEIPEGSTGALLTSQPPHITCWDTAYNGYEFLTTCLDTVTVGCRYRLAMAPEGVELAVAADIVGSLTDVIASCIQKTDENKIIDVVDAAGIVDKCVSVAPGRRQVGPIVFDILEQQLELEQNQSSSADGLVLIRKCVHFVYVLALVDPDRVWEPLSRSRFLDSDGVGSALSAIVTSREMVVGKFGLLLASIRLYEALLAACLSSCVRRQVLLNRPTRAVTRFDPSSLNDKLPTDRMVAHTMASFTKVLVGLFESYCGWRYQDSAEKTEIGSRLMVLFHKVLRYVYGRDGQAKPDRRLLSMLHIPARHIADSFLSTKPDSLSAKSVIGTVVGSVPVLAVSLAEPAQAHWPGLIKAYLQLAATLLRVQAIDGRPTSWLEKQLFRLSAVLVRVYVAHPVFRVNTAELFEAMIEATVAGKDEPTSLLGHLGPASVRDFLDSLLRLAPFGTGEKTELAVWRLVCSAVRSKQRSFALALVTGATPRGQDSAEAKRWRNKRKSVFRVGLRKLSSLSTVPLPLALVVSQFVASAMDFWQAAVVEFGKHKKVFQAVLDYLGQIPALSDAYGAVSMSKSAEAVRKRVLAATIVQVLAIHVHHERQMGRLGPLKAIADSSGFFMFEASRLPPYNQSLHFNLARNFTDRFGPFELNQFRRTVLATADLGTGFFYDTAFADKVLCFDPSWHGDRKTKKSKKSKKKAASVDGMRVEFERANMNLSWVEAQVRLMASWSLLVVELGHGLATVPTVCSILLAVIDERIRTVQESTAIQPELMDRVRLDNLQLSFTLMQQLFRSGEPTFTTGVRNFLVLIWDTIVAGETDFGTVYALPADRLEYFRMLVRMLHLSLGAQAMPLGAGPPTEHLTGRPAVETLIEILDKVVLRGFRSFVTELRADPSSVDPADLTLITATLQALLTIPSIQASHAQVSLLVGEADSVRIAISLFSWADRLTGNDPIYAELAIQFIVTLSSVPLIAESMAVDGILGHLSASGFLQAFQAAGSVGPLDRPARMNSVWTYGVLPLCLNMLDSVGPSFGADMASFLNQFSGQLARNADTLASIRASIIKPETVHLTIGVAAEAHSLALLALMLDSYRAGGAALGVVSSDIHDLAWDRVGMADDIKTWLQSANLRRERLVPATDREVVWFRTRPSKKLATSTLQSSTTTAPPENMLEEKLITELEGVLTCLDQAGDSLNAPQS